MQIRIPHLDELVDDFFATVVRTRPWEKPALEAVLEPLVALIEERHGAPAEFAAFTPEVIGGYLAALPAEDRPDAERAIASFRQWATGQGWL